MVVDGCTVCELKGLSVGEGMTHRYVAMNCNRIKRTSGIVSAARAPEMLCFRMRFRASASARRNDGADELIGERERERERAEDT